MAELIHTEKQEETVILVAVSLDGTDTDDTMQSLEELKDLVKTAGATTVGMIVQNRERIHPGTYVGSGKIEEIREMLYDTGATGIVCDDELTPAQLRNLRDELDTKVMDRTLIILDIFASRASSAEGKIQVELAQQRYILSRLSGLGKSMSRLGGGIGTRGPGEKKLEMDRRYIRERLSQLKKELSEVERHRELTRKEREKSHSKTVAIVGYTNAGKSTLLNTLTDASVLEEDKLFATLDPTTRALKFESGQEVMLTDTVGFIRKLPHHLVEAFKSTLEEAKYADYILHVVDASNPQMYEQMYITYETLESLGAMDKKIITLFNKIDRVEEDPVNAIATGHFSEEFKDLKAEKTFCVSIKEGLGLDAVKAYLEEMLRENQRLIEMTFSYEEAGLIQQIRKYGELLEEEYRAEGIFVRAYVPIEIYGKLIHG